MFKFKKFFKISLLLILMLLISVVSLAQAGSGDEKPDRPLPDNLSEMQLDTPIIVENVTNILKLDSELMEVAGTQSVIVRLSEETVAEVAVESGMSHLAQLNQSGRIQTQQDNLIMQASRLDADSRLLGSSRNALNAVMLDVDASALEALAQNADVVSIHKIVDYEMDLSETVPYIGGTAVQSAGYDGSGVRVAVLDSGVDYYHANLGGSGDPNDFNADDPTLIETGTFPTAKVVGGYDFVGSNWASSADPVEPDPDPLDDGPGRGHGTHVADIIGGAAGVAPGADIYAVKVCSSISTGCSGIALINGMEFAVDPNGDGNVDDAVDVINMSLGSDYGNAFDDDLSYAVEMAAQVGVLTVSSAGNGSDKPYVSGSPANAPSALSVAQTNVPSAFQPLMEATAPASITGLYDAVFQPWSAPLTSIVEAPLVYGDVDGDNLNGCDAFDGDLSGKIVLVDRGACNFTLKILNINNANGLIGIIGLVAPGDPFSGGDGGDGPITIPGYMISQADSAALKSGLPDTVVRFDPDVGIPLMMHMVGSSSRGPAMGSSIIKPEIGAPGASVSAIAGSGVDEGAFGGTSGAAPMVSGAAALLIDAYPDRSWAEIKALLINTGETDIINKAAVDGGDLAAITRIGGGEVRVDRALDSMIAAWNADAPTAALSFGFHEISEHVVVLQKRVVVQNYTNRTQWYKVSSTFRFANDEDAGVRIWTPRVIRVRRYGRTSFPVLMIIKGADLHDWTMNSGSSGADPATLTLNEYDGYIWLDNIRTSADDADPVHLPWQVLPRKASRVYTHPVGEQTKLTNFGVDAATVEAYSLIGVSDNLPEGGPGENNPTPDIHYLGYTTIPVPAGFCSGVDSFLMVFAFNTWEPVSHLNGLPFYEVNIDADQDGVFDYSVYNFDISLSGALSDGRHVTWVDDLAAGTTSGFFFTDHDINSGNTTLTICGEQIGMNADDFFEPMNIEANAVDWFYGNGVTDSLTDITISPLGEQYVADFDGDVGGTTIEPREHALMSITDYGVFTNNTETGILLLYRGGNEPREALAIEVAP